MPKHKLQNLLELLDDEENALERCLGAAANLAVSANQEKANKKKGEQDLGDMLVHAAAGLFHSKDARAMLADTNHDIADLAHKVEKHTKQVQEAFEKDPHKTLKQYGPQFAAFALKFLNHADDFLEKQGPLLSNPTHQILAHACKLVVSVLMKILKDIDNKVEADAKQHKTHGHGKDKAPAEKHSEQAPRTRPKA